MSSLAEGRRGKCDGVAWAMANPILVGLVLSHRPVKTLGNENEFFSWRFSCKYTFMFSDCPRGAHTLA
jgi:hypothetical protein